MSRIDDLNERADALALPRFYPVPIEQALTTARERCEEWSYEEDPHGYCHDRPELVALIKEVERRRPEIVEHAILFTDGGMKIRSNSPETERVYPLTEWIKHRHEIDRTTVYRRTVIVVEDWVEVPRG